jgi:hypothetical protein
MCSTSWSWSSMFIAIMATVCPMPDVSRSASRDLEAALPRMTPP